MPGCDLQSGSAAPTEQEKEARTLELAATEYGAGPPLVILHGLFGSARNWATIAQRLSAKYRVLALDLRNHGASPWAGSMDYGAMAEDVRATLRARGHRRFALVGHSMGGKTAMIAALRYGGEVERLVVVDIAPVAYELHHRALIRALQDLDLAAITRRRDADAQLARSVPDDAERGFLLQNLLFNDGHAKWRLNLAAIDRELPRLAGFTAPPGGDAYAGPALFVAGARSDYVRPEHGAAIRRLFPHAAIAYIADAGHWLHVERPQAFFDLVEPFLAGGG
jgi:esterase